MNAKMKNFRPKFDVGRFGKDDFCGTSFWRKNSLLFKSAVIVYSALLKSRSAYSSVGSMRTNIVPSRRLTRGSLKVVSASFSSIKILNVLMDLRV